MRAACAFDRGGSRAAGGRSRGGPEAARAARRRPRPPHERPRGRATAVLMLATAGRHRRRRGGDAQDPRGDRARASFPGPGRSWRRRWRAARSVSVRPLDQTQRPRGPAAGGPRWPSPRAGPAALAEALNKLGAASGGVRSRSEAVRHPGRPRASSATRCASEILADAPRRGQLAGRLRRSGRTPWPPASKRKAARTPGQGAAGAWRQLRGGAPAAQHRPAAAPLGGATATRASRAEAGRGRNGGCSYCAEVQITPSIDAVRPPG